MVKQLMSKFLLLILAVNVFVQMAQASQSTPKVVLERYSEVTELPKAKHIRVINPFGNITTRTNSYHKTELSGVIQKIGDHWTAHKIDIRDNNGVTEVVVSYPEGNVDKQGRLTGRFDLGVWVPSFVTVEMVTDYGDIKVKKSSSNIIAKSISGKISIGTSGEVVAQSQSGNVKVNLKGEKFRQPMKISSQTGDVRVYISEAANLNLTAKANSISTKNLVKHKNVNVASISETLVSAKLGAKGTELDLASKQGELFIALSKPSDIKYNTSARLLKQSNN